MEERVSQKILFCQQVLAITIQSLMIRIKSLSKFSPRISILWARAGSSLVFPDHVSISRKVYVNLLLLRSPNSSQTLIIIVFYVVLLLLMALGKLGPGQLGRGQ